MIRILLSIIVVVLILTSCSGEVATNSQEKIIMGEEDVILQTLKTSEKVLVFPVTDPDFEKEIKIGIQNIYDEEKTYEVFVERFDENGELIPIDTSCSPGYFSLEEKGSKIVTINIQNFNVEKGKTESFVLKINTDEEETISHSFFITN